MILQALHQYYERKSAYDKRELAPYGFEFKAIPVIVEINTKGKLIQIYVTKTDAPIYLLPQAVKKTAGIAANLLWDNVEYALGLDVEGKTERVKKQHQAFIEEIRKLHDSTITDEGILALLEFLEHFCATQLLEYPEYEYFRDKKPNVAFMLQSDSILICEREPVMDAIKAIPKTGKSGLCLVTAQQDTIARLHPAIKGVGGAQSSGANIVSFNLKAFESYGKSQGFNAPVGERANFTYTTALNHLLKKGSGQRVQIGDASVVFWAEKETDQGTALERSFGTIFGAPPKKQEGDDPDKNANRMRSVYRQIQKGSRPDSNDQTRFYILGLSPNAARIAIRFWQIDTVQNFWQRFANYFDELEIVHGPRDYPLPLFLLLTHVAVKHKIDNIPPTLAGEVTRAILSGLPYPHTFLSRAVARCKAEQKVSYPRAAIIKAWINRSQNKEELKIMLDKENHDIAYRLGRWFATLEKVQEDANPGINATIRDRYYSAASSSPVSVFSILDKLHKHHLSKLGKEKPGMRVNREKLMGEIMQHIPPDIPKNFPLQDQGRFAIGYYHQRQDFFTKNKTDKTGATT